MKIPEAMVTDYEGLVCHAHRMIAALNSNYEAYFAAVRSGKTYDSGKLRLGVDDVQLMEFYAKLGLNFHAFNPEEQSTLNGVRQVLERMLSIVDSIVFEKKFC